MAALPTTSYALLGLLLPSPMSGYELAARVEGSITYFWPIARSQVYGELNRLEGLGYVRGADVAQDRLPDKRLYEVTREGAAALDAWLVADPEEGRERFRSSLMVRVFFAPRIPLAQRRALLERIRSSAAARRAALDAIVERLAGVPEAAAPRATALHGLRHAEATLAWLDEVSPLLVQE